MWRSPASIGTSSIWFGYSFSLSFIYSRKAQRSSAMSETAHPEPNYMGVFWWLLALTIVEVAVSYLPIAKFAITIMLITMAVTKAVLVALYFMHLKFERRTLALVAVC